MTTSSQFNSMLSPNLGFTNIFNEEITDDMSLDFSMLFSDNVQSPDIPSTPNEPLTLPQEYLPEEKRLSTDYYKLPAPTTPPFDRLNSPGFRIENVIPNNDYCSEFSPCPTLFTDRIDCETPNLHQLENVTQPAPSNISETSFQQFEHVLHDDQIMQEEHVLCEDQIMQGEHVLHQEHQNMQEGQIMQQKYVTSIHQEHVLQQEHVMQHVHPQEQVTEHQEYVPMHQQHVMCQEQVMQEDHVMEHDFVTNIHQEHVMSMPQEHVLQEEPITHKHAGPDDVSTNQMHLINQLGAPIFPQHEENLIYNMQPSSADPDELSTPIFHQLQNLPQESYNKSYAVISNQSEDFNTVFQQAAETINSYNHINPINTFPVLQQLETAPQVNFNFTENMQVQDTRLLRSDEITPPSYHQFSLEEIVPNDYHKENIVRSAGKNVPFTGYHNENPVSFGVEESIPINGYQNEIPVVTTEEHVPFNGYLNENPVPFGAEGSEMNNSYNTGNPVDFASQISVSINGHTTDNPVRFAHEENVPVNSYNIENSVDEVTLPIYQQLEAMHQEIAAPELPSVQPKTIVTKNSKKIQIKRNRAKENVLPSAQPALSATPTPYKKKKIIPLRIQPNEWSRDSGDKSENEDKYLPPLLAQSQVSPSAQQKTDSNINRSAPSQRIKSKKKKGKMSPSHAKGKQNTSTNKTVKKTKEAVHSDTPKHVCRICGLNCGLKKVLDTHMKNKHPNARIFKCKICEKAYTSDRSVLRHFKTVHEKKNQITCNDCGKEFKNKNNMMTHFKYVHLKLRPYACSLCNKTFKLKYEVKKHCKSVHNKKGAYQCMLCNQSFSVKFHLKRHLILVHSECKNYLCPECGTEFKRKGDAVRHMELAHGNDKFICEICGSQLSSLFNLSIHHKYKHSNKKSAMCSICHLTFTSKADCNRHKRDLHTTGFEGIFKCKFCPRHFSRKDYLTTHCKLFHPLPKNFKCGMCKKRFETEEGKTEHQRLAHKRNKTFVCMQCEAVFTNGEELESHVSAAHLIQDCFGCALCAKCYRRKISLRYHIKANHNYHNYYNM